MIESYAEAVQNRERTLARGKRFKAEVFLANSRGSRFVVKDFTTRGFLERNLIGRLIVSREYRAYRALNGIGGIPGRYRRISPYAFVVEYLEGRDLGQDIGDTITPEVIGQLERIVNDIHERGWVHLDLQRRSNILLVSGKVYVIDLASAAHPGAIPLIGRWLSRLAASIDRLSLIKIKKIYAPEMMNDRDRMWLRFRNMVMPRKW